MTDRAGGDGDGDGDGVGRVGISSGIDGAGGDGDGVGRVGISGAGGAMSGTPFQRSAKCIGIAAGAAASPVAPLMA